MQLCDECGLVLLWFIQCHLAASQKKWREEIELERTRSERLVDQLNDLSDVHQDELIAVKQVLFFIYC